MKKLFSLLAVLGILLLPSVAAAQLTINPSYGTTLGLGTADLVAAVIRIIQYILAILGLIAVVMILLGGFRWMTAAGNEEKVASAKKILSAAIIGLVIIILAWAIVFFVSGTIRNTT